MTVPKLESATQADGLQYDFGPFSLRPDGTLLRDSAVVALPPKETALLQLLVVNAGQIVPAEQLRQAVWGQVHVSPDSLPKCISSLRTQLGSEDCIQTVYKRGYRLHLAVNKSFNERRADWVGGRIGFGFGPNSRLPRLAIMPFTVGAGVPQYLGAGIAEETMLALSRLKNPVADLLARDSVFSQAAASNSASGASGDSARRVARALDADLVLSGSITALPRHLRFRVEMIRVADTIQLWVEDFLLPHELLASADARIARRISVRIRDTFAGSPAQAPAPAVQNGETRSILPASGHAGTNPDKRRAEAYSLYLQARAQWDTFQRHQMHDAMRNFQHVLELDPDLVSPRIHLMHGYLALATFGYLRADAAAELARAQAEVLLATTQGQSAHAAMGWIHFFHDRNLAAATTCFDRPQTGAYNPWTSVYRARFALGQGRLNEAIQILRAALVIDPFSPVLHWRLAWALHLAGDADGAIQQARATLGLFPNDPGANFFGSIIFAAGRNPAGAPDRALAAEAVTVATRLTQSAQSLDSGFAALAYAHARQGNHTEARALLDRQQWLGKERFVMRSFQAPVLVELEDYDAAIAALTSAEEQHCTWLFELLGDPRLRALRGEAEFQRLGRMVGHMFMQDTSVA